MRPPLALYLPMASVLLLLGGQLPLVAAATTPASFSMHRHTPTMMLRMPVYPKPQMADESIL